ncbi:MAG TPA: hypothetical protein VF762_24645, partial [Blastocatellia bacterium]
MAAFSGGAIISRSVQILDSPQGARNGRDFCYNFLQKPLKVIADKRKAAQCTAVGLSSAADF